MACTRRCAKLPGPGNGSFVRYFLDFRGPLNRPNREIMTKPADRVLYSEPRPDGRTPYWTMRTIWAAAEGKPAVTVAIEDLNILDAVVWFGGPKNVEPTVRRVAERARDISSADLSYPIIMTRSDDVLDGAHRIAKAYLQGERTISAVVIDDYPPPDGVADVPQS
jgi:hypothetical protein